MIFKKHITKYFSSNGRIDDLKRIEEAIKEHKKHFIIKTQSKLEKPERLLGENGLLYIQRTLYRSQVIIEGVVLSLNNRNVLMAILGVRSHIEITGTLTYLHKRLKSFYAGNISYEDLDRSLYRLSLGGKVKDHSDMPDPIGVMDLIDSIDDYYKKISGSKEKMFRVAYDNLSEFCHPNCFGLFMGSDVFPETREVIYHKPGEINEENYWFVSLFLMSIATTIPIYNNIFEMLEKNEVLPNIFR
ncbi:MULTISPECIES: hypothetical protein [Paenibacillus]|uniref:Uncharacterized protein n=2 Tax=Paenibacillus TaxID=44249 RepID=A0A1H8N6W7_9BACL|nr:MULTISPECIES: hypothetical protein [Paenibacillus]QWU14754.1 hypothetical protein KP014_22950 [Paenibacillus sophorae]RQW08719.1 hypothetical protein EH198_21440 [Paenibacillus rhizophilus]SEO25357.1 hypothetical protein SAMN04487895_10688 [Paenibacillus sophorae]